MVYDANSRDGPAANIDPFSTVTSAQLIRYFGRSKGEEQRNSVPIICVAPLRVIAAVSRKFVTRFKGVTLAGNLPGFIYFCDYFFSYVFSFLHHDREVFSRNNSERDEFKRVFKRQKYQARKRKLVKVKSY